VWETLTAYTEYNFSCQRDGGIEHLVRGELVREILRRLGELLVVENHPIVADAQNLAFVVALEFDDSKVCRFDASASWRNFTSGFHGLVRW
jgi:hypothetical protein